LGTFNHKGEISPPFDPSNNNNIRYGASPNGSLIKKVLSKHKKAPGFSAMQLESSSEIYGHIEVIYDLLYNHYILGKQNNSTFPHYECNPSAQNIMIAGMVLGDINASVFGTNHDHCYTAFPFLLKNKKGIIIADPTSDQLWNECIPPRNHIFVVKDQGWAYETDWKHGGNLFPNRFMNLDSLRINPERYSEYNSEINEYFKKVFQNPVKVHLE